MKKYILSVLMMALPVTSHAFEFTGNNPDITLSYHVFTKHTVAKTFTDEVTGNEIPWKEDNRFVGIRWNFHTNFGVGIAQGDNSFYENSTILEFEAREPIGRFKGGEFDIGGNLFLASGYEQEVSGGILPGVNPFFRYRHDTGFGVKFGSINFITWNIIIEQSFSL